MHAIGERIGKVGHSKISTLVHVCIVLSLGQKTIQIELGEIETKASFYRLLGLILALVVQLKRSIGGCNRIDIHFFNGFLYRLLSFSDCVLTDRSDLPINVKYHIPTIDFEFF